MLLVVLLTVRVDAADAFEQFEAEAARVMAEHGGRIERTVRIPGIGDAAHFQEVHLVHFPDDAAFAAYRADPRMAEAAALRERAVVATELLVGEPGPDYHAL